MNLKIQKGGREGEGGEVYEGDTQKWGIQEKTKKVRKKRCTGVSAILGPGSRKSLERGGAAKRDIQLISSKTVLAAKDQSGKDGVG